MKIRSISAHNRTFFNGIFTLNNILTISRLLLKLPKVIQLQPYLIIVTKGYINLSTIV
jgi:hypothetical protein